MTNGENMQEHNSGDPCPALPGTVLRIYFPPGTVINLLNIVEVSSPGGICLIVRLPLLGEAASAVNLSTIVDAFRQAGAQVSVMKD